jgi:hypothetical protein
MSRKAWIPPTKAKALAIEVEVGVVKQHGQFITQLKKSINWADIRVKITINGGTQKKSVTLVKDFNL